MIETERPETTRAEHLAWCKGRALKYVERGDLREAYASMASDMGKHPETAGHSALTLGMALLINGHLDSAAEMRRFIEGFN
jgi:putative NIF3 family GTP cyclohydrolase 1 type 2